MKKEYKNNGFTLIELLVVIAVIGILAAVAVFSMQNSFQTARDTQRKSDLKQYQAALEVYANNNDGLYVRRTSGTTRADTTLCNDLGMSSCPSDPINSSPYFYYYTSDSATCSTGGSPCATEYILKVRLESKSSTDWMYCSNGKSGEIPSGVVSSELCPL